MPLPDLTRVRDVGRPLNAGEFDADIDNLDQRLTAIEDDPPTAISVVGATAAGDQLTFALSDSSSLPAVTMPFRRLNPIVWAPGIPLAVDHAFPFNGSLWVVIYPHTTAGSFDAFANDGLGHNYYFEMLPNPGNSLPDGGELGQVLVKLSGVNYAVGWRFLDAVYVTFTPSTASDLTSDNVSDALEELEALIASAVAAVSFDATEIPFNPSTASGLSATTVDEALDELATRTTDFTDLTGTIAAAQRDATVTALGATGTVSLDPALGDVFTVTPSGAITLNAASAPANARVTLIVTTSGTSSYNITPSANFKSAGALATGTVSGKSFSISFVGDGTNLVETGRTVAM